MYVYILHCADDTLYTGSTTDIDRRIVEHNTSSRAAKYTRARRPVVLAYKEQLPDISTARKREAEIKRMTRNEKLVLVKKFLEKKKTM